MSASTENDMLQPEDALDLVQAQSAVSEVIFAADDPIDIVRALHRFTGNQFSSAELGRGDRNGSLRLIASGAPGAVRPSDRAVELDDYPGMQTEAGFAPVYISDLREDRSLDEAERERLRARSVRSLLVEPLVVRDELIGVLAFMHTDPINLSPARRYALHVLAEQLATTFLNRRLLEAAQTTAAEEQALTTLFTRFDANADAGDLIGMALTSLGQLLGAERGAIRIGQPDAVITPDERPTYD